MEIRIGAPAVSMDGADLGKIDKVVFDPQSGETKSLVISKGMILARNVAVDPGQVRVAAPGRVELSLTKEQVDALPDFVEGDYTWPPENWAPPYGWPAGAVMWPMPYSIGYPVVPPYREAGLPPGAAERARRDALENAVVGEGASVLASGGEKVGSVHTIMVDPATSKPSRMILRRGLVFTEDVELPGDWISSYDDETVTLNVDKVTVEQLAKHQS